MIKSGQIKGTRILFIFIRGKFHFFTACLWDFLWCYYHVHSVLLKKKDLGVQQNFPMVIATSSNLSGRRKGVRHCLTKGQKSKFIFNPSYCSYCLTLCMLPIGREAVSCRIKRCCICWQSKFLIIFFVLLWDSVSEVSSREISWNFMDSWPRINWCLEISSPPLGWEHIDLHVKRKTCLLSAILERIYCLGKMSCFQFSWNSGIPKLACWHQPSKWQETHSILRGTKLLLWISCRNSLK